MVVTFMLAYTLIELLTLNNDLVACLNANYGDFQIVEPPVED